MPAFPASVCYGAILPVSTMLAAAILALVYLGRRRWLLAGLCGAVAALVKPSGFLVGTIALIPLTAVSLGDLRSRVRATLMVGLPIAIAYAAVMANFQRAVGAWDAWYKTAASHRLEATFPLEMIRRQVVKVGYDAQPRVIGAQTLLVAAMVVAAGWVVVTKRHELSLGERGTAVMCLFLWVMPLTLDGNLPLYRAELLLLPIVILLTRLRSAMLAAFVIVCVNPMHSICPGPTHR